MWHRIAGSLPPIIRASRLDIIKRGVGIARSLSYVSARMGGCIPQEASSDCYGDANREEAFTAKHGLKNAQRKVRSIDQIT